MPVDLAKAPNVVPEVPMPPPANRHSEVPLFRGLDELRSGHCIGCHGHERMLHMVAALLGTGVVFGVLYASMLLLE
jgi:hypothetical protein